MNNEDLKRFFDVNPNANSAKGFARLNSSVKIPADLLPSYVDDVIEGYYYNSKFYEEAAHTTEITPETGKIYIDLGSTPSPTYRWGGTVYVMLNTGLPCTLQTTAPTAAIDDGGIHLVILSAAPATEYNGYIYMIKE